MEFGKLGICNTLTLDDNLFINLIANYPRKVTKFIYQAK
jgi:hypothetical protein